MISRLIDLHKINLLIINYSFKFFKQKMCFWLQGQQDAQLIFVDIVCQNVCKPASVFIRKLMCHFNANGGK